MFCTHCGSKISDGAHFCRECGKPVTNTSEKNEISSKTDDNKEQQYLKMKI